jgi:hypothetical protein
MNIHSNDIISENHTKNTGADKHRGGEYIIIRR